MTEARRKGDRGSPSASWRMARTLRVPASKRGSFLRAATLNETAIGERKSVPRKTTCRGAPACKIGLFFQLQFTTQREIASFHQHLAGLGPVSRTDDALLLQHI